MVAFIEYFVGGFEKYLKAKILSVVNRNTSIHIRHYKKTIAKAEGLSRTVITPVNGADGQFNVKTYVVDIVKGFCSCFVGATGACCKHQIAVAEQQKRCLPNVPVLTASQKQELAMLALGEKAPPVDFFEDLDIIRDGSVCQGQIKDTNCEQILQQLEPNIAVVASDQEHDNTPKADVTAQETQLDDTQAAAVLSVQNFLAELLEQVDNLNGSDKPLLNAVLRLHSTLRSKRHLATTIHNWCDNIGRISRRRIIRVQSTASGRRRKTSYRGGRSLSCSRVRAHRLSQVISKNQMPAKKH